MIGILFSRENELSHCIVAEVSKVEKVCFREKASRIEIVCLISGRTVLVPEITLVEYLKTGLCIGKHKTLLIFDPVPRVYRAWV